MALEDLSILELDRYIGLVGKINEDLCCGKRDIAVPSGTGPSVLAEVIRGFEAKSWRVGVFPNDENGFVFSFSNNMPKPTDNKPADLRSPV